MYDCHLNHYTADNFQIGRLGNLRGVSGVSGASRLGVSAPRPTLRAPDTRARAVVTFVALWRPRPPGRDLAALLQPSRRAETLRRCCSRAGGPRPCGAAAAESEGGDIVALPQPSRCWSRTRVIEAGEPEACRRRAAVPSRRWIGSASGTPIFEAHCIGDGCRRCLTAPCSHH